MKNHPDKFANKDYPFVMEVMACYMFFLASAIKVYVADKHGVTISDDFIPFADTMRFDFKKACSEITIARAHKYEDVSKSELSAIENRFLENVKVTINDSGNAATLQTVMAQDSALLLVSIFKESITVHFDQSFSFFINYIEQIKRYIANGPKPRILWVSKTPKTDPSQSKREYMKLQGARPLNQRYQSHIGHVYDEFMREKSRINTQLVKVNSLIGDELAEIIDHLFEQNLSQFSSSGVGISSVFGEFLNFYISVAEMLIHAANIKKIRSVRNQHSLAEYYRNNETQLIMRDAIKALWERQ